MNLKKNCCEIHVKRTHLILIQSTMLNQSSINFPVLSHHHIIRVLCTENKNAAPADPTNRLCPQHFTPTSHHSHTPSPITKTRFIVPPIYVYRVVSQ